ncbi:glutathione S-transferase [Fragilaria crotonensis]|nr:glutathione S-transferase [Fragilaria crotonensis]
MMVKTWQMRLLPIAPFLIPLTVALQVAPARSTKQRATALTLRSVPNSFDTLTSGLASIFRLPNGVSVVVRDSNESDPSNAEQKQQPQLTLFDIENNDNCRLVRERLTELDLNFKVVPSTPNSKVFLDPTHKYALAPGTIIPTLRVVGDNPQEVIVSGAPNIVEYLDRKFSSAIDDDATIVAQENQGEESSSSFKEQAKIVLSKVGNTAASWMRAGRGCRVSPAASDSANLLDSSLVLYSYEGNQFCRLVREVLTELDIAYELRSAGKGSPRRAELAEKTGGSTQCPCLIDMNTSEVIQESADIVQYLYSTYGKYTPPNELLQFASDTILPLFRSSFAALTRLQAGAKDPEYEALLGKASTEIAFEKASGLVVVYTYELSPFSWETKLLLDRLNVDYLEISLGKEWFPGFINEGGALKRAALLATTGQSSLPHIFIGGRSIGGLFDGNPGLVTSLSDGSFWTLLEEAKKSQNLIGSFE